MRSRTRSRTATARPPCRVAAVCAALRDVEDGSDFLSDAGAAKAWLVEAGLLGREAPVSSAEIELARRVRESIRGLVELNDSPVRDEVGGDPGPLREPADTQGIWSPYAS
jgi:hypothetical protein